MNMKKVFFLLTMLLLIFFLNFFNTSFVFAKDLSISIDQSEYFFLVGEVAKIPFKFENTYDKPLNGILKYTLTKKMQQSNINYSSTNTQSTTFLIKQGTTNNFLSFGTSNTPTSLNLDLKFSYFENEQREINLNDIVIHFVEDPSKKQNKKNKTKNLSEKSKSNSQNNPQDPLTQQKKEMQKILEQMSKQQNPQTQQQKLQNNQLVQDSSALKKEIQKKIKEQQKIKDEFRKNIAENKEFQKKQKELLNEGFSFSRENLEPKTSDSGEFEIKYKNKNGEKKSIKGKMEDKKIKNLETHNLNEELSLLEKLKQNPKFKKFQKQLKDEGFTEQNNVFSKDGNNTTVKLNYKNDLNQTAKITANFENNKLVKIKLEKDKNQQDNKLIQLFGLLAILSFFGYFLYKKYLQKHITPVSKLKSVFSKKPFNHIAESQKLLKQAEKLFEKKQFKEAHSKAGQAMRLFLSYEYGLGYELTNYEICSVLKKKKKLTKNISECFNLCSLVEFAKYKANKKNFKKIVFTIKNTINEKN